MSRYQVARIWKSKDRKYEPGYHSVTSRWVNHPNDIQETLKTWIDEDETIEIRIRQEKEFDTVILEPPKPKPPTKVNNFLLIACCAMIFLQITILLFKR